MSERKRNKVRSRKEKNKNKKKKKSGVVGRNMQRCNPIAAINCSSVDRRSSILECISRANQPPRVSGSRVESRTTVRASILERNWNTSQSIYQRNAAREQPDILETDRSL